MGAKSDCDRNGARADGERERQREECVLESVLEHCLLARAWEGSRCGLTGHIYPSVQREGADPQIQVVGLLSCDCRSRLTLRAFLSQA